MAHKQTNIFPKGIISVDEMMVPLIKYLNSWNGIITMFSCQGDGYEVDYGYVVFVALLPKHEEIVLEFLRRYADVSKGNTKYPEAYTVDFRSFADRDECLRKCRVQLRIDKKLGYI